MIEQELQRLLEEAKRDSKLKQSLIDTENSSDPISEFCSICKKRGYKISAGELMAVGQNSNDAKLRSVNGGGVDGIDGWDDAYEQFLLTLKWT